MFGMGFAEMAAIAVVAVIVFGPDRLPELAQQAASFVKTLKRMSQNAREEISREMKTDMPDLATLRELDPRNVVRETFSDVVGGSTAATRGSATAGAAAVVLRPREIPPFDPEAT